MTHSDESLRGYGHKIHQRDDFTCRYCGVDGKACFDTWLTLTVDHLLPKGHPKRECRDFKVTACHFCNTADNRYFDYAEERGLEFDGKTPDELVKQRKPYVERVREDRRKFWEKHVKSGGK